MYQKDTIAAIATGMTNAGIGIIRVSGEDAIRIADQVFQAKNPTKKLNQLAGYTALYGNICDGDTVLDEAVCLVMRAPYSYTTEDVVEIQCHGGIVMLRKILELVVKQVQDRQNPANLQSVHIWEEESTLRRQNRLWI